MQLYLLKKRFTLIIVLLLAGIFLWLFRTSVLRAAGDFLICEDELHPAGVIFVLGGGSYDRGNEAARLFKEGYAPRIVCLGENVPSLLKALALPYSESAVTRINLLQNNGIDGESVYLLQKGTSTQEEARFALNYCLERKTSSAIVVSSKFHTRRVSRVFKPLFAKKNITLIVWGAPSTDYSEEEWWKTEEGLIMVNNEYVKLIYYLFKY